MPTCLMKCLFLERERGGGEREREKVITSVCVYIKLLNSLAFVNVLYELQNPMWKCHVVSFSVLCPIDPCVSSPIS